jgi:hypothetical protein
MRRTLLFTAAALWASQGFAAATADGRWQGAADIPGQPLHMVVDLARNASGAWSGSVIVPALGLDGIPLDHIVATRDGIAFDLGEALRVAAYGPARITLKISKPDAASGTFEQGGHVANVSLHRVGAAQVEEPPRSTAIGPDLVAHWTGSFELGGYPRQVTIELARGGDGRARAKFTVVGKKVTDIPVDRVMQRGDFVRIESDATQVSYEGRVVPQAGEIRGTIAIGAAEFALVLARVQGDRS